MMSHPITSWVVRVTGHAVEQNDKNTNAAEREPKTKTQEQSKHKRVN